MTDRRFHLAWFMNFTPDEWNDPFGSGGSPWSGDFYVEMARALERACFSYMIIEDTLMVSEAYGGSMEAYLKYALMAPKHDPAPLAALMSAATSRLGIVATMLRYDSADEYMDLVGQLWDSWEPGAVVLDRGSGTYADHRKVHTIDFRGRYFTCRGPLNTVRSPQGRPAFIQAGGSPRGREFAAKTADSIIATATGIEGMRSYRDDVRARAEKHGRHPDDVKVLFLVSPILGETEQEARARQQRRLESETYLVERLAGISSVTDVDFSQFDLDEMLPDLTTNGEQGSLDKFAQRGSGKTLRQLVVDSGGVADSVELVGTPEQVAQRMGEVMADVGGDGFLISSPGMCNSRRYITEIADGLVPALQRRGLVRTEYTSVHLRDTLTEF